jgi:CheY-like chemotaxis protein
VGVHAHKPPIVQIHATGQEAGDDHADLRGRLQELTAAATFEARQNDIYDESLPFVITSLPEIACEEEASQVEGESADEAMHRAILGRSYVVNPQVPDDLMQLVDELKWARNQLRRSLPAKTLPDDAAAEIADFDRITDELRETVATIWLQPTIGSDEDVSDVSLWANGKTLQPGRVTGKQIGPTQSLPPIDKNTLAGQSILVVDSSLFFRHLATAALGAAGAEVTVVRSAAVAVEFLKRGEWFDAILLEIDVPEIEKREMAAWTREGEGERQIPFIGLASRKTTTDPDRIRQAGFDRCVAKFHTRRMIAALAELCRDNGDVRASA